MPAAFSSAAAERCAGGRSPRSATRAARPSQRRVARWRRACVARGERHGGRPAGRLAGGPDAPRRLGAAFPEILRAARLRCVTAMGRPRVRRVRSGTLPARRRRGGGRGPSRPVGSACASGAGVPSRKSSPYSRAARVSDAASPHQFVARRRFTNIERRWRRGAPRTSVAWSRCRRERQDARRAAARRTWACHAGSSQRACCWAVAARRRPSTRPIGLWGDGDHHLAGSRSPRTRARGGR